MDIWDHRNRLLSVRERATDGGDLTKVVDYVYDSHNRWIGRAADLDGAGSGPADTIWFTYDANQIVYQFDGTGALTRRNLWGPAVDQILAEEEFESPSAVGDVLWPLTDQIGSVRDVAQFNAATATTQIIVHRVFDSFGKLVSETGAGSGEIVIGFTGRPFDKATELQNNLNRWFDPVVASWVNEDPSGFAGADANLHRYIGSNPLILTDPLGLAPMEGADTSGAEAFGKWLASLFAPVAASTRPVPPTIPPRPDIAPGPGWKWDPGIAPPDSPPGTPGGSWVGPEGDSLHPDLHHPPGKDPHWGWKDRWGNKWEYYPDTGKWIPNPGHRNNPNKPQPEFPPRTAPMVPVPYQPAPALPPQAPPSPQPSRPLPPPTIPWWIPLRGWPTIFPPLLVPPRQYDSRGNEIA